ncbi:MAG: hypothetical protein ACYC4L_19540 [Chloroflexota bacterium]
MNEKTFRAAKSREQRRFYRAVGQVLDRLLAEKFEQTRELSEYRRFNDTCNYVRGQIHLVDALTDRLGPMFERDGERTNWEVYLSGLRQLCRDLPRSYLYRIVLPMFGLEDLQAKLSSYTGRALEALHGGQTAFASVERYLLNLERADALTAEYQAEGAANEDLPRLYASLKTWETAAEQQNYYRSLEDFIAGTLEVLVLGPIQMYLLLGRETFTLIFKSLSVGRLADIKSGDGDYVEMQALHDFVHSGVENSAILTVLRAVVRDAGRNYVALLRDEEERLRAQLPNQDLQRNFVRRFEAGSLFPRAKED